jgi:hypothetical protein
VARPHLSHARVRSLSLLRAVARSGALSHSHARPAHTQPSLPPSQQLLMRRNSVYIAFILGGAMVGERVSVWWREEERAKPPLINPGAPTLFPRLLSSHAPPRPLSPFLPSGRRLRHQLGLEVQQQG